jgi:uncharacterized repeat protein (TIGR01451 family)
MFAPGVVTMSLQPWRRAIARAVRPASQHLRIRPRVQQFEQRIAPAIFNIANGDIPGLITAINTANINNEPDTINLAVNGKYNFTTAFDVANEVALPIIELDSTISNVLTINGRGSTFNNAGNPGTDTFRYFIVNGQVTPTPFTINDLTFDKGNPTGDGGAFFISGGTVILNNVSVTNSTARNAGAIGFVSTNASVLTMTNCNLTGNSAVSGFGGAIAVQGTVTLSFTGCNIKNNASDGDGSGVWIQGSPATFSKCIVSNNTGTGALQDGGGIFIQGDLTFSDGDVSGNSVVAGAGGIFCQGNVTVRNSSLTANAASSPVSAGGAIFVQGDLIVDNSTIDGNRAGSGGAIDMAAGAVNGTITNSTITSNSAFFGLAQGGGIFVTSGATLKLGNSIVALNSFEGTVTGGTGTNINGAVDSLGYNIIGTDDGITLTGNSTGNFVGTLASPFDPMLGPLGNYGGIGFTRPPLAGSPVIDSGDPNFVSPPDFDQRGIGFPRVLGGRIDIGALEARLFNLSVTKDDGLTTAVPGQGVVYTIIVSNSGPSDANGVSITDILSAAFTSGQWTATFSGGAAGNTAGNGSISELVDIPIGGAVTYLLAAAINPSATGAITNTATVMPPTGGTDPNAADDSATDTDVLTPVADVSITSVTSSTKALPGQTIHYVVTVRNDGPSTAFGAFFSDVFSSSFDSESWSSVATGGATGNSPIGSGNIAETLNVPPNATVVYMIDAVVSVNATVSPLVHSVTVSVAFDTTDPVPDNNTATNSLPVIIGGQVYVAGSDAGSLPTVKVFNSLSGALRKSFQAYDNRFRGGVRVAVADFNGDGTQDIVTAPGPGGGPDIKVFDGKTGLVICEFFAYDARFTGGVYIATGDVNGDGTPDIITGAGAGGGPHVRVFNGLTGHLVSGPIGEFFAFDAGFHGGVRVAAGDTNKDGKAEVITAAGPGGGPHVIVWNAVDRTQRFGFFAYPANFHGGVYVTAGDANFDGVADIITGAGEGGGPLVRYFDGRNGAKFREFYAYPPNTGGLGSNALWTSGVRVGFISDIDNDGLGDLVVSPGAGRGPNVRIYSGGSLGLIRETSAFDPSFLGGVFVGGA